jgi:hypothetical protein
MPSGSTNIRTIDDYDSGYVSSEIDNVYLLSFFFLLSPFYLATIWVMTETVTNFRFENFYRGFSFDLIHAQFATPEQAKRAIETMYDSELVSRNTSLSYDSLMTLVNQTPFPKIRSMNRLQARCHLLWVSSIGSSSTVSSPLLLLLGTMYHHSVVLWQLLAHNFDRLPWAISLTP